MKIYSSINCEQQSVETDEVTFAFTLDEAILVKSFLEHCIRSMKSKKDNYSHEHFRDFAVTKKHDFFEYPEFIVCKEQESEKIDNDYAI
jgi:hypothetical protein